MRILKGTSSTNESWPENKHANIFICRLYTVVPSIFGAKEVLLALNSTFTVCSNTASTNRKKCWLLAIFFCHTPEMFMTSQIWSNGCTHSFVAEAFRC